ncbi:MAG: hypothetical protein ACFCUW_15635 [Kiloniellaceae bacterium]
MTALGAVLLSMIVLLAFAGLPAPFARAQHAAAGDDGTAESAMPADALNPWTRGLDGIVARRMIRAAIPYGIATYFLYGADQKGVTYDLALAFERALKKQLRLKDTELTMVVVQARRDEIFQMLTNAGPGNVAKVRRLAEKMGFDPNVWFGEVEIAAAKAVSREPVVYVRNIYKYYVAYRRVVDQLVDRRDALPQ